MREKDIAKIIDTYQYRKEEKRYARRVLMEEIKTNDYNLNISRYVSTAKPEPKIDLKAVHKDLQGIENDIVQSTQEHNKFLQELGLKLLPTSD
ncbi:MAG: N-6 DNA methylase [Gammaproteobacteria bacterium]|nr:N-6 DNA methylase [Gammaproteobacteria bacterium]